MLRVARREDERGGERSDGQIEHRTGSATADLVNQRGGVVGQ
jgi:hypothetical protein